MTGNDTIFLRLLRSPESPCHSTLPSNPENNNLDFRQSPLQFPAVSMGVPSGHERIKFSTELGKAVLGCLTIQDNLLGHSTHSSNRTSSPASRHASPQR